MRPAGASPCGSTRASGSGGTNRTNTGGPASSFGIWHEHVAEVKRIAEQYSLTINRIHSHIGSGSDPEVYKRVTRMTLDLVEQFPDATVVNLGGGFKVGRMPGEVSADLQDIGHHVERELIEFQERLGRRLHLEAEPGTYLVANAGAVVATLHRRGGHRQGRVPVRQAGHRA